MNSAPTIPAVIADVAIRTPGHPALALGGTELSYADLDRRVSSVANMLIEHGVRRGDRVGLYAHKSIELLVAMHGIMRAGAAYVPINPDAPAAYLGEIIDACSIRHLFAGPTTRRALTGLGEEYTFDLLVGVDSAGVAEKRLSWDDVWKYPDAAPGLDIAADDLAYIMFTSGSTGRPKGIMHTHASGLAYGRAGAAAYGFTADDRLANHAPLNFDLCLLELWGGIVAGSTVVIVPEAHGRLPASFSKMLQDEHVTVVNAVPYALVQLLHRGALADRDLSAIRWVIFGGENFPTKDLRGLMQQLPRARFANVYGPAEVNGVTYFVVPEIPEDWTKPISIGRLYPGMQSMILDPNNKEVSLGETGELLIKSPTQMVGYWQQPELTAHSTYSTVGEHHAEERWHRTGDLVRQDESGLLWLTGRKDRMIKTRGHRVELDEIETTLNSHVAVEQAVVYTVPDGEGSQQIQAAVIVRDADHGLDTAGLKQHVAAALPRYAVPRVLEIVPSVPRTSSGKPDRVALAAAAGANSQTGSAPHRPSEREA